MTFTEANTVEKMILDTVAPRRGGEPSAWKEERSGWKDSLGGEMAAASRRGIHGRVGHTGILESPSSQDATVAPAAGLSCRRGVVAAMGQAVVDAQFDPLFDDLRLFHPDQRRPELGKMHGRPIR